MTYQPAEDTYLLLQTTKEHLKQQLQTNFSNLPLKICEVGCGSGEIITTLKEEFSNEIEAYATDINPKAVEDTLRLAKQKNISITAKVGSFLEPFEQEVFDSIIFNTPYLPCEDGDRFDKLCIEDKALYGGKAGFEVTNQFLDSSHNYIHSQTQIYILISSLTQPNVVEDCIVGNGLEFELIATQNHFFEELLIYKVQPALVLQHIFENSYSNILRFDRGRHSHILQAQHLQTKKKVMIKFGKKQHIEKEIFFLQKLQDTLYAPKIVESTIDIDSQSGFVMYEKINGIQIEEFINSYHNKYKSLKELESVLNRVFEICYDLDIKGISKDEMTHPQEHIFINLHNLNEVFFIDFERSVLQTRFSNSRQFLQYCIRKGRVFEHYGIILSQQKVIVLGKKIVELNFPLTIQDIYE
ncbi:MAG: HemK2/MTQ2 family protein methyltransferase [Candidatus Woesearchaeota archaeon]